MFAVTAMGPRLIDMDAIYSADENRHGSHGGQSETSVMLHLHPELVEMNRAENFVPLSVEIERESEILGSKLLGSKSSVSFGWQAQDPPPKAPCGDATNATPALRPIPLQH